MIHSYFRQRLEMIGVEIHHELAQLINSQELLRPLLDNIAVYKGLEVDPDWIVTVGASISQEASQPYPPKGELQPWTLEVVCRHKTNANYFFNINLYGMKSNSGSIAPNTKPQVDVTNLDTHLDYEAMRAFIEKLRASLKTLTLSDAIAFLIKVEDPDA